MSTHLCRGIFGDGQLHDIPQYPKVASIAWNDDVHDKKSCDFDAFPLQEALDASNPFLQNFVLPIHQQRGVPGHGTYLNVHLFEHEGEGCHGNF